jgi:Rps23 Pro-64 3,4-dihydroxylase Tpa1-like proline 4-hydroxylase
MPHRLYSKWLGGEQARSLLAFAIAEQERFTPSTVTADAQSPGQIDVSGRRSRVLRELGPFQARLREKALAIQSELEAAFGMPHVPSVDVEIELVAHGDGDYFQAHIDTFTRVAAATDAARRLSLVYYVHRSPRGFTGGQLRLHSLGAGKALSLEPAHDTLVAFPSFLPHEVEPIVCPDNRFADSRFSVNIWLCGPPVNPPS